MSRRVRLAWFPVACLGAASTAALTFALPAFAYHETDSWERVVLANPAGPDALIAGAIGGATDAPVLLVDRDRLPAETRAELVRRAPAHFIVVGGTAAISNEVVNHAIAAVPAGAILVTRCAGATRYSTAAECAKAHFAGTRPKATGGLHK